MRFGPLSPANGEARRPSSHPEFPIRPTASAAPDPTRVGTDRALLPPPQLLRLRQQPQVVLVRGLALRARHPGVLSQTTATAKGPGTLEPWRADTTQMEGRKLKVREGCISEDLQTLQAARMRILLHAGHLKALQSPPNPAREGAARLRNLLHARHMQSPTKPCEPCSRGRGAPAQTAPRRTSGSGRS